jgi:hypothetical protein
MSQTAYELALIRRDQLLSEAADRRLATESAPAAHRAASATPKQWPRRLARLQWLVRTSQVPSRLAARGR